MFKIDRRESDMPTIYARLLTADLLERQYFVRNLSSLLFFCCRLANRRPLLSGLAVAAAARAACFVTLLATIFAHAAVAAPLLVQVDDARGQPVADAVVYVTAAVTAAVTSAVAGANASGAANPPPAGIVIDQIKRQFVPMVSVMQKGGSVSFPNKDNFEHDVYSFSNGNAFKLNLYHGVTAKPVRFDHPGVVVMGCSIHDQMVAYLLVVDTPYYAKTDAAGKAMLEVPGTQPYKVTVWHYRMPADAVLPSRQWRAGAPALAPFALALPAG